jgi:tRNA(Ile2) C34 agmatinyltransferase TiaS
LDGALLGVFVVFLFLFIGVLFAVIKVRSDAEEGITPKCQFCGAKMGTQALGTITMPVCQKCGRTQPWARDR